MSLRNSIVKIERSVFSNNYVGSDAAMRYETMVLEAFMLAGSGKYYLPGKRKQVRVKRLDNVTKNGGDIYKDQ